MRPLFAVLALLCWSSATLAETRVALVVGNSDYSHVRQLPNPAHDAEAVAGALRGIGFDVRVQLDLGYDAFRRALRDFGTAAADADIAVVFYAGHGIEVDKVNYLIPVDARMATDRDVQYEAVPLDLLTASVEGARSLRMVLLDACRDNPFKSMRQTKATRSVGRGLARIEPAAGTLVAYAAKEGTTAADGDGRQSPFTEALLEFAPQPGLEINFLFRRIRDRVLERTGGAQEPFVYGSLPGREIYLVPPAPGGGGEIAALAAELKAAEAARRAAEAEAKAAIADRERAIAALRERESAATDVARRYESSLAAGLRPEANPGERRDAAEGAFALGIAAEDRRAFAEAVQWLERAAEAGHLSAMVRLAALRESAPEVRDPAAAERWLRRAAEAGDAGAAFRIGKRLEESGSRVNLPEAADWYRRAAEAGNGDAMNNYATMLASGSGVARDDRAALDWYRRGSEKNNSLAMFNLAAMYDDGRSVKKNPAEAAELILRALRLRNAAVYDAVAGNSKAWSRDFALALQKALARDGFYRGKADGAFGKPMLAAMQAAMK